MKKVLNDNELFSQLKLIIFYLINIFHDEEEVL